MNEQGVPLNVCFVPLGGKICECGNGDITWFVSEVNINSNDNDRFMTYSFKDHPDFVINARDSFAALKIIFYQWIVYTENNIKPRFKMYVDGKEMNMKYATNKLEEINNLLQMKNITIKHKSVKK